MAFAIATSALHRPLGFELAQRVQVVRHASPGAGAAAAALLPPDDVADAQNRRFREELRSSGGFVADVDLPAGPLVAASARGVVDGQGVSILGHAAGRPLPHGRTPLRVLLLTDARLAPPTLEALLEEVAARSFASLAGVATPLPGDAIVALANGVAGESELAPDSPHSIAWRTLLVGAVAVAQALVRRLLEECFAPARARVVQVTASGAVDEAHAAQVAELLAADASVRAAMATSRLDRDLVAAAVAKAGARGTALKISWAACAEQAALRVDLASGHAATTRWTAVPE